MVGKCLYEIQPGGTNMPAAARMTDPLSHGGTITSGEPLVLIGHLPAARLSDSITCATHGPGVIVTSSGTVMIGNSFAARLGDQGACGGPGDLVVGGEFTVLIG
jgi:uncharacterized Zn-binding protein involved in type VI secretion